MNNNIIFFDLPNSQNSKVYNNLKDSFNIIFSKSYPEIKELINNIKPFLVIINKDNFAKNIEELYHYLNKTSPHTLYLIYSLQKNKKEKLLLIKNFADDCIFTNNPSSDIIAKIISFYRRFNQFLSNPKIVRVGDIEINYHTQQMSKNDRSINLTNSEFKILDLLLSHQGHVFTRKEILKKAFSEDQHLKRRSIDVYIRRLRKNITKIEPDKDIIITIHRLGYKFHDQ